MWDSQRLSLTVVKLDLVQTPRDILLEACANELASVGEGVRLRGAKPARLLHESRVKDLLLRICFTIEPTCLMLPSSSYALVKPQEAPADGRWCSFLVK